jgi:hypothetical protein
MGMDALDIVFRIEKNFQVKVSKDDFLGLVRDNDVTAGDLYSLLLQKLHLTNSGRHDYGLNLELWAEMQRLLYCVTLVPIEQIQLQTPLEQLFPRETRRETWDALRETSPYRIAELDYPPIVRWLGFLLAAAVVVIEQFHLWQIVWAKWLWPVLGILGLWMVSETYLKILSVCSSFRDRLPARMKTVKDLCRAVLAANYTQICTKTDLPVDERSLTVWEQLVEILSQALGVEPDHVTFRSRLVRDLGME